MAMAIFAMWLKSPHKFIPVYQFHSILNPFTSIPIQFVLCNFDYLMACSIYDCTFPFGHSQWLLNVKSMLWPVDYLPWPCSDDLSHFWDGICKNCHCHENVEDNEHLSHGCLAIDISITHLQ